MAVHPRARQRRGRFRSDAAGRSLSADGCRLIQRRRRAQSLVHDGRTSGLPQAVGHGRQDRLCGSRSHRRLRDHDCAAVDDTRTRRSQRSNSRNRARAAPAYAYSPVPSPTMRRTRKGCCSVASSAAGRPNRLACRRATSSSRSPASRSPTSTITPTRWSC